MVFLFYQFGHLVAYSFFLSYGLNIYFKNLPNFQPLINLTLHKPTDTMSSFICHSICRCKAWSEKKSWFKHCFETKMTKVYSRILLMKSSKDNFGFLLVFHLIMCLMKAPKNFGKIAILKIWELISLGDVKTHFGKLALKWCIFRHEKKPFWCLLHHSFWPN